MVCVSIYPKWLPFPGYPIFEFTRVPFWGDPIFDNSQMKGPTPHCFDLCSAQLTASFDGTARIWRARPIESEALRRLHAVFFFGCCLGLVGIVMDSFGKICSGGSTPTATSGALPGYQTGKNSAMTMIAVKLWCILLEC